MIFQPDTFDYHTIHSDSIHIQLYPMNIPFIKSLVTSILCLLIPSRTMTSANGHQFLAPILISLETTEARTVTVVVLVIVLVVVVVVDVRVVSEHVGSFVCWDGGI